MADEQTVFVVDDDRAIRESLSGLLEASGYRTLSYDSAKAFLASGELDSPGCAIVDIRMPDMDGLELQAEMNARASRLPVIIMTGHGDIPLAVRAMKAGAVDFLEKPYDTTLLLEAVKRAVSRPWTDANAGNVSPDTLAQLDSLTPREREVLDMVVAGKLNKVIAYDLSISQRTVEVHRARLMKKLGARNMAELMRMMLGSAP